MFSNWFAQKEDNLLRWNFLDNPNSPIERYGHSCVCSNQTLYIFGGASGNKPGTFYSDLYKYSIEDKQWTTLTPLNQAVHFHSAVVHNDKMYIFGGKSNGYFNDINVFNLETEEWNKIDVEGKKPEKRYAHTSVVYKNKMYVFGGYDSDAAKCDDLWSFDFKKNKWEKQETEGNKPESRFHHTSVVWNNSMWVFGGSGDKSGLLNDMFKYDFKSKKWEKIKTKGTKPSKRKGHAALVGNNSEGNPVMWVFGSCHSQQFNFETLKWKSIQNSGNAPVSRHFHSAVLDDNDSIILFGGKSDDLIGFNEMYFTSYNEEQYNLGVINYDLAVFIFDHFTSRENSMYSRVCSNWNNILKNEYFWEHYLNVDFAQLKDINEKKSFKQNYIDCTNPVKLDPNSNFVSKLPVYDGMKSIKVVLVGDGAVGKTCTLISYTSNSFPQDYVPTIFDNYSANVNVGTETISLGLWDTAGPEDYDRLRPLSYPQTSIFIAMFSVLSRVSFSNITTKWVPEIKHHCPNVPIILVGNKIDLYNDPETLDRLRGHGVTVVTEQEAKDLAAEISIDIGAPCIYCPSSALTQEGLKSVFETAMKLALFGDSNEPEEQKKCLIQ